MLTIDDTHTRDMDDAVEVEETPTGWLVRVAIADAAREVTPGSDLDKAARARGNTLYFATGNSPMLPREVSEWKLSLWPEKKRRAVVVEMRLSPALELESTNLTLAKIESQHKLSYKQIPALLVSVETEGLPPLLRTARKLALGLLAKRRDLGAMVFYDLNNGWVTTEEGAIRKLKDHTETIGYIIVQELMILANTAVASYAAQHGIPLLFRNHETRANAAPDRAEIQKLIGEAVTNPIIDLEAFQNRTHKLFRKAEYGAQLVGHAGLNLLAYTHFTSPIRRYADLMVHQQLRAHIKGESLPHTETAFAEVATHLNDLALKERDSARDHFKGRDEELARLQVEARKLDGIIPKQFERVVKVEVRSGESPSKALETAWVQRLWDGAIPSVCMTTLLMHGFTVDAGVALERAELPDGWRELKTETLAYLRDHTPDAITILTQATALGWPAAELAVEAQGNPQTPRFVGTASMRVDGELIGATAEARNSKEARQRAAVALLAELSMAEPPEFSDPAPSAPAAQDSGKHPVSQLMEHAQRLSKPPPHFDFVMKGEAHMPVVTCNARFLGYNVSAVSTSKPEAKLKAAEALLAKL